MTKCQTCLEEVEAWIWLGDKADEACATGCGDAVAEDIRDGASCKLSQWSRRWSIGASAGVGGMADHPDGFGLIRVSSRLRSQSDRSLLLLAALDDGHDQQQAEFDPSALSFLSSDNSYLVMAERPRRTRSQASRAQPSPDSTIDFVQEPEEQGSNASEFVKRLHKCVPMPYSRQRTHPSL